MAVFGNVMMVFSAASGGADPLEGLKDATQLYLSFDNWQPFFSQGDYIAEVPNGALFRIRTGDPRTTTNALIDKAHEVLSIPNRRLSDNTTRTVFYNVNGDIPFTFSYYIKLLNKNNGQQFVSARSFANNGYYGGYRVIIESGFFRVLLYSTSDANIDLGSIVYDFPLTSFSVNVYNSIMISYNGDKNNPLIKLYINAIDITPTNVTNNNYTGMNNSIGASREATFFTSLNGYVDELNVSKGYFADDIRTAQAHHNNGNGVQLF